MKPSMSSTHGKINTPNLKFLCLSSVKLNTDTQVSIIKSHSMTQHTYSMIKALKYTSCDSKLSNNLKSQYFLLMQVQAQQRCSNAIIQKLISYSHAMVATLTLTKLI